MSISALGGTGIPTTPANIYPTSPGTTATASNKAVSASASPTIAQSTSVDTATAAQPADETVKKAAATVKNFVNSQANTHTEFSVDSGLGVVKVMDTATNQEITQYPSKAIVAMAQAIEQLQGLMSNTGVLHNSTA